MKLRSLFFTILLCSFALQAYTQTCNTPGQNPSTAFPVCGTGTFIQSSVNLCGGKLTPSPKCPNSSLQDVNPYWYKFTCFQSGTLGFTVTPNSSTSDYDWQLYDVTNRDVNAVYTNPSWVVSCNWSEYYGTTGTTATAANVMECEGKVPQYSRMPDILVGHDYILLVSHFSNTQAGYRLDFNSGTAVITDTARPALKTLKTSCASKFFVKLNKKMKCSSIATDGSDWEFANASVPIASVVGVGCTAGFETDSLIITTVNPVVPGNYTLRAKNGTDGNTMLDLCDAQLPVGAALSVQVGPIAPAAIDSIGKVRCKPSELVIWLSDPVLCKSIAADGSDFTVTGPSAINVSGAVQTDCVGDLTQRVKIQLASPIQTAGIYTVTVKLGTDGNTIESICGLPTPVGSSKTVEGYDTVSARFNFTVNSSCKADTVVYTHPGGNGIIQWQWREQSTGASGTLPSFKRIYEADGQRTVNLAVSNGVCADSASVVFSTLNTRVKAAFEFPAFACPKDSVLFVDKSTGPVAGWKWIFGNGQTSFQQRPPLQFFQSTNTTVEQVSITLVVSHANGCSDTLTQKIKVPNNCYIAVPSGFTPNGDGLNDYLYPLNAYQATNLQFLVYNRYGQVIFQTNDWNRKWDGKINGLLQPAGNYAWKLEYTDIAGKRIALKGTTMLIR
ncbi:MAG TPA: T9SS type B sorting domain-containing protein [Phnomibacter sp.]|nr:T9SS type B sorting domain-containing protein [Phnomibacter sp.]